jgi:hypothetical protein
MKILTLLLLTSCTLAVPTRSVDNKTIDKMQSCVVKLIGDFAIKAKIAQEVCSNIHKKGE